MVKLKGHKITNLVIDGKPVGDALMSVDPKAKPQLVSLVSLSDFARRNSSIASARWDKTLNINSVMMLTNSGNYMYEVMMTETELDHQLVLERLRKNGFSVLVDTN